MKKLAENIRRRAAAHKNAASKAWPGSPERAIEERLAKECSEIAEFIDLNKIGAPKKLAPPGKKRKPVGPL